MRFVIKGGKELTGSIPVRGAKNSVMKAMAAALLFDGPIAIANVPQIEDVFRVTELLESLGTTVRTKSEREMVIDPSGLKNTVLHPEIARRLRASIVVAGPLLARSGAASFPHPGGDVIGKRPIDFFIDGWRAMGATVTERGDFFEATAPQLKGADFSFPVISVTGTETLMMSAVLASGKTMLRNAALEPEIPALANFLNECGADIRGAGTSTIEVHGTGGKLLHAMKPFVVIPDRIEAGSFVILGAALGKNVKVVDCNPEHISFLLRTLMEIGVPIGMGKDWITVSRPATMMPTTIITKEYPGFPTDLQAPFTTLMTQARGVSTIKEEIFESRFGYVFELNAMGANIRLPDEHTALVQGPTALSGREVRTPDVRAGLAFIMAALLAKGESIIENVYQIDRGYEKIDERLRALGAAIERTN